MPTAASSSSSSSRRLQANHLPRETQLLYTAVSALQSEIQKRGGDASFASDGYQPRSAGHNDSSSLDSLRDYRQATEHHRRSQHRHHHTSDFLRPPRPEPFEVDSVSADDLIRANASAAARRSDVGADRSMTSAGGDAGIGYRSSLGQRWSGAFADMEHELMLSSSAAAAGRVGDGAAAAAAAAATGNTGNTSRPATAAPGATGGPLATTANTSRSHIEHLQAMEATVNSINSLELDALRRQSADLARVRVQLKDEAASHSEALAALKVEHQKDIEQLTKSFREAKERLVDETYNSRSIAFTAKEELWQAELETMKLRIRDTERAHEAEKLKQQGTATELRNAMEQVQQLRGEVERLDAEVSRLNTDNAVLRRERVELNHGYQERDSELRAAKHREQLLLDEGHKNQARMGQLEEALRMLDLTSKEQMRKLENEFTQTNLQFEMLLNETNEKAQKYERVKGRYKTLKEAAAAKEKELESALHHATILNKDLQTELDARDEELRNTRATVSRKEHELREERGSHADAIEALQDRLAEHKSTATEQEQAQNRAIAGLEKTIVRLQQERVESAQRAKISERDLEGKVEAMALLEEEITRLKDLHQVELSTQNERHVEALEALKRTVAEKDRRLKQLTAESAEPLHKLRRQLDDERSKRAQLEQQLEAHKRMAREAEEESRRELRREQLRPRHQSPPETRAVGPPRSARTSTTAVDASAVSNVGVGSSHRPEEQPQGDEHGTSLAAQHSTGVHTADQQAAHVHVANAGTPTFAAAEPRALPPPVSSMVPQPRTSPARTPPPPRNVVTPPPMPVQQQHPAGDESTTPRRALATVEHTQAQHEHKLAEFHSATQEVYQRIMGSQEQFWKRCTDVVRSGPAAAKTLRIATALSQRSRGEGLTGGAEAAGATARGEETDSE